MDKNPLVLLELVERLGNLMRAEARRAGSEEQLAPVHVEALVLPRPTQIVIQIPRKR